MTKTLFLAAIALGNAANGQANVEVSPDPSEISEGTRLRQFEDQVKSVFPQASSVKESSVLPSQFGGTSLMGLVHRLLGESTNREHEGLKTKRYIYRAYGNEKIIGLVHGSTFDYSGAAVDVILFYEPNGVIKNIRVEGAPTQVMTNLENGGYLKQFVGKSSEDFEVTLGRKGRIKTHAPFLARSRKPGAALDRAYFDKITRAVRFNSAFMEIAYFIAQHPTETVEAVPPMFNGQQSILKNPFDNAALAPSPSPVALPLKDAPQQTSSSR